MKQTICNWLGYLASKDVVKIRRIWYLAGTRNSPVQHVKAKPAYQTQSTHIKLIS